MRSGGRSGGPASLRSLLHRAHITLAVGSVAVVGLVLAVPAVATLHLYAGHNLGLLARAVGHTAEAAVVFGDADAALEELVTVVGQEDVAEASVLSRDGRELAHWREGGSGWQAYLDREAARLLYDGPVVLPVMHDGAVVGQVRLRGGGRTLLQFLGLGAIGILCSQVLIALWALFVSGRIQRRIVPPLLTLAEVAGSVQRERAFSQRVPGAAIMELNDLGASFNGLLAELEEWQTFMTGENERLSHQASHDSLTGLPNRAFFEGRLHRALNDARQAGSGVAVMLIDCDKFKAVNDSYGHAAGDAVLVGVAARLKGQMRERDLVARLGGDEFAILIAPAGDMAGLRGLVATIGGAMEVPISLRDELAITQSLSIGLAVFPEDGANAAALLAHADGAMYRAKDARATRLVAPGVGVGGSRNGVERA